MHRLLSALCGMLLLCVSTTAVPDAALDALVSRLAEKVAIPTILRYDNVIHHGGFHRPGLLPIWATALEDIADAVLPYREFRHHADGVTTLELPAHLIRRFRRIERTAQQEGYSALDITLATKTFTFANPPSDHRAASSSPHRSVNQVVITRVRAAKRGTATLENSTPQYKWFDLEHLTWQPASCAVNIVKNTMRWSQ